MHKTTLAVGETLPFDSATPRVSKQNRGSQIFCRNKLAAEGNGLILSAFGAFGSRTGED